MTLALRTLDIAACPAWDAFVDAMPQGTFFHRAAWARVVETAFGHRTHYAFTERDGAITGVLPLAQVKSRLFGNTLISNPFCVYGGVLAADQESADRLRQHAGSLLKQTRATAVELRDRDPADCDDDWIARPDLYVTAYDNERNMKAIPRKQRAMVRKGIQNGLVSVIGHDVRVLHRLYAESVRNLGTPVFSRRYFSILAEVFRDCADVRRSKIGTGAHAFKHNWGFVPAKLNYRFKLAPGASIPDHNPLNPKYRLFINAWKRLPLPVANLLGPPIVRGLG